MEESEGRWFATHYGIVPDGTAELSLLSCGASLRQINGHPAVSLFGMFPLCSDGEPLGKDDAGLLCRKNCPMFDRCPLVKAFVEISASDVEREILRDILLRDLKRRHRDGNLPHVGDSQGPAPAVRFRFIFSNHDDKLNFIIPPMAPVVYDCDDCGNAGRECGEADERVENGIVDVHAGSIAQPNQEGK